MTESIWPMLKYQNKPVVTIDGQRFDSEAEARRCGQLITGGVGSPSLHEEAQGLAHSGYWHMRLRLAGGSGAYDGGLAGNRPSLARLPHMGSTARAPGSPQHIIS